MQVFNRIDEQNRMLGLPLFYHNGKNSQADSHGYSYIQCREMYKSMGYKMGLDFKLVDEDFTLYLKYGDGAMEKLYNNKTGGNN